MIENGISGAAPWPTGFGASNSNASPSRVAAQGRTLWWTPLPDKAARGISVAANGYCFVALERQLLAIEPGGRVAWTAESERLMGWPVLDGDCLIIIEDGGRRLTARDAITGEARWSRPAVDAWALVPPALAPGGHILYAEHQPPRLQAVSASGEPLWSQPLEAALVYPPLVLDDLTVVGDEGYLRAFSLDGALLWIADRQSFRQFADSSVPAQVAAGPQVNRGKVDTPVVGLGSGKILAGLSWHTGQGFFIFDTLNHTVQPLQPASRDWCLLTRKPLAVVPHDRGPCLATVGREYEAVLLDLQGDLLWGHKGVREPGTIIADASGKVIISYSPQYDIWRRYRDYFQEPQCMLKCLDAGGQEIFTWIAPGHISRPLAIGKEGEVYLVAEGTFWAIG